ncbi:MAG: hypothetical protein JW726_01440 [Anaerolineales bacterium]|nr:hypothetical protein [Anaerolineales bacterium]
MVASNSSLTNPNPAFQIERRRRARGIMPTTAGDVCVLLISKDPQENKALYQQQQALQGLLGGKITQPVHLTCQKMAAMKEAALQEFISSFASTCANLPTFQVTALAAVPFYSDYRQAAVLKWQVQPVDFLQRFCRIVETTVLACGLSSKYPKGWTSTLVTALEDIRTTEIESPINRQVFPQPLFTASQVRISRVLADGYEIVSEFPLSSVTH